MVLVDEADSEIVRLVVRCAESIPVTGLSLGGTEHSECACAREESVCEITFAAALNSQGNPSWS